VSMSELQLTVLSQRGVRTAVSVYPHEVICVVKRKYVAATGVPVYMQRMLLDGSGALM
jgi:hypothetical protein